MDEDFEYFLEKMGPAIETREVPPSSIERYLGKLPDQLLGYWAEYGWCGYADGLFWTVNPQDYEPALEAWIGDTPFLEQDTYHVVARSAFGELYLWGEKSGNSLDVFAPGSFCTSQPFTLTGDQMDFGLRVFFGSVSREENDFEGIFTAALRKLGRLRQNETYGFVPALALGGAATVNHLQKMDAVAHLVLLAQLAPLKVICIPSP